MQKYLVIRNYTRYFHTFITKRRSVFILNANSYVRVSFKTVTIPFNSDSVGCYELNN